MCDTLVSVRADAVLFGKNSDRDPNEGQVLEWHPARSHAPGDRLRCTWIEIDEVARTHAVLLSRPFWMWGAEMGANEHGVVIGNEAVFTRSLYADTGLLGMDMLRLALERATTAQDAVGVIVDLLERHGQGGGCGHEDRSFTYHNSFIVADATGATVLETAGRHWATETVTGARSISNGLTIPGFREEHTDPAPTRVAACAVRRRITEAGAASARGTADVMDTLRLHTDGAPAPSYSTINGAMSAPCMHAGGVVAASQTTASWVASLGADGAEHWVTATAAPCTSLFKPVRVSEPVDLGPEPTDAWDPVSLWWRHERLHRAVMRDPTFLLPRFTPERDATERAWLIDPPDPAEAFAEGDRLLERWTAAVATGIARDRRPLPIRRYWRVRDERAGLADARAAV